ncbi:Beta-1,3-glucanase [Actinopolyspora xinjiangensis]|uniref:Beta-1,3-glucanase n=1 Tax=Actinopolyspora xinjiangensis TaxID=405564 RepID=A0A1H0NRG2_9ACTN|nr:beta-1,3-glucanase family protein [Actinopolyspora xinjiangensis]SDO95108.1 Beta-1,3-glucanase [Actinopolyspora xinjiangensis]
MFNRRTFLGGLSTAALAAPVLGGGVAAAPRRRARLPAVPLPLTVVNHTGAYANTSITLYIVGVDQSGRQVHVTPDGRRVPISFSDNESDGYAHYGIPLNSSGDTTISLPAMSGRVYFALGGELKFKVVESGTGQPALRYPAGWVPSDPSNTVLHDVFEFTLNETGMYCNTTMVDMFSVPSSIRLVGSSDQTTGTLEPGGRDRIFANVTSTPGFENLRQGDHRIVAPGHALDLGDFSSTYFDSYIDQVWEKYRSTTMTVDIGTGVHRGSVSGDRFVFDGEVGAFDRPSTRDVLFCDGALFAGAAPRGPVAAILGAGLNRSNLHSVTTQPATNAASFYGHSVTNHYAKTLHANTVDGKAYGFAFDDVAGYASYVQDSGASSATLTLTPL